jgi:hypothetical protein
MKVVIGTWFHADDSRISSKFSQVGGDSTTAPFQAVYWRCVMAFCGSSLRWNRECQHALVTNLAELPHVEGISTEDWLQSHNVSIIRRVPLSRITPEGFWGAWRNQFYVFDALQALGKRYPEADVFVLLDSDCVWMAPHNRLTSVVAKEGIAVYTLPFKPEHVENGVCVGDIANIGQTLLGANINSQSLYHGGELQAFDRNCLKFILDHVDCLFAANLAAFRAGRPYLKEEAHFLSALYALMGARCATANEIIRRIWTGPNYFDVAPGDANLDIWHVPNEKRLGLARLFRKVMNEHSWFWHSDPKDFRRRVGRLVGIPRRSAYRLFWDRINNRIEQYISEGRSVR